MFQDGQITNLIDFQTSFVPNMQEARVAWDDDAGTLQIGMPGGNVVLDVGQEQLMRSRNVTGSTITNGSIVYITGAQGNKPTIALAQANSDATADRTIGMATEDIDDNSNGYVCTQGMVRDVDTSGFSEGNFLYLSATTAGAYTNTPPAKPNHYVEVGVVLRSHASEGVICFHLHVGQALSELHDVSISSLANNDVLKYNSTSELWENTPQSGIDHGLLSGLSDDDHPQYHNDARALSWLGTRSTTDLQEGTNLYYTDTRVDSYLSGGEGVNYSSGVISADINLTNLKITSGKINTIQDISTSSSILFTELTLDAGGLTNTNLILNGSNSYVIRANATDDLIVRDVTSGQDRITLSSSGNVFFSGDIYANNLSGTNTGDVTVSDTSEINFSLSGQDISASLVSSSIDESKLDSSVNASLDLADSSIQPGDNVSELVNDAGYLTSFKYISQSFTSQTSITVTHNFSAYPIVQVLNSSDELTLPVSVVHNSANDFTVMFSSAKTGKIIATAG